MDKNAIKKYAVWARRELIDRVTKRAAVFGVTNDGFGDPNADSVNGHLLSNAEKHQRQALIRRIEEKGYEHVMEEVAYTWFNRFAALRFMEVNGLSALAYPRVYGRRGALPPADSLRGDSFGAGRPEHGKGLSDEGQQSGGGAFQVPAHRAVQRAERHICPACSRRLRIIPSCCCRTICCARAALSSRWLALIPEDDWKDQVQIIGWLYQYYNTEPKDKVFANLKRNIKISKENIPAATQLFTPDWIVRYMVENSLGRLWLEGHPSARDKYLPPTMRTGLSASKRAKWNYYLDEAPSRNRRFRRN